MGRRWICSKCGNDHAIESVEASIDDRFAIGYCGCTPPPNHRPTDPRRRIRDREKVPLVRSDAWDPKVLADRRQREADRRLLRRFDKGKATDSEAERARGLLASYRRQAAQR